MKQKIHELFYNIIAQIYNAGISIYFNKKESNPRNIVAKLVSESKGYLLEVCAGTCEHSIKIAKLNSEINIIATDKSNKMLQVAKRTIKRNHILNIDVQAMDATNLNFENEKFDIVVLSLALHELKETTQRKVLTEIYRVLKKSGKLIVVEWNRPKTWGRKIKFSLVELVESSSFRNLMQQDMNTYFTNVGFTLQDTIAADYTKVYNVIKCENDR